MSRQINLYSPAFRAKSQRFSAVWLVAAAALVVVASLANYALQVQRVKQIQSVQTATETGLKRVREQLLVLGKQAQPDKSKTLADQVARAEALLGGGQELIDWLRGGAAGNSEGYAKFLSALARQHLDGVWLSAIEISGAKNEFVLKGRALRADLVPGYIKLLRNEDAFRGKSIGTLVLHEIEIDEKGEQKAASGAETGVSAAAQSRGGQAVPPAARPALRVIEFSLGTEAAAPSGKPGRP